MSANGRLPREADALLRGLMEERVVPLAPGPARELRARVVARIDALEERAVVRRRSGARWFRRAVFVAAACVPLAVWAVGRAARDRKEAPVQVIALAGSSAIERDGTPHPLPTSTATPLDELDELFTGQDGRVRASLPTGAVVQVGSRSKLRFARAGERRRASMHDRIELLEGKIDVQVPKLGDGGEVSVHAGEATVVVHGTKFSVEQDTAPGARSPETRIEVTEGTVAVYYGQEERMLSAGGSLVLRADAAVPWLPVAVPSAGAHAGNTAPGSTSTESTLAAENGLLSDAMRMRRDGDGAGAVAAVDELLRRYPASPLAESARVEKLRVLTEQASLEPARREAERYLADYPHGFARGEALRVLGKAAAHRTEGGPAR